MAAVDDIQNAAAYILIMIVITHTEAAADHMIIIPVFDNGHFDPQNDVRPNVVSFVSGIQLCNGTACLLVVDTSLGATSWSSYQ